MNAPSDFYVLLLSLSCGIAGGVFYDAFHIAPALVRAPRARCILRFAADALSLLALAALYILLCAARGLPSLRLYSFAGCMAGLGAAWMRTRK